MSMKTIGIVANAEKDQAPQYTLLLKEWLVGQGLQVLLDEEIAGKVGEEPGVLCENMAAKVDLVIVLGGDGTMLRVARAARQCVIPIVGINMGGFGYLTEINLNEMYSALELILRGNYQTERRMMLDVTIDGEREHPDQGTVLNDVVINRGNLSRIVQLETAVNGRYLTTFKADGLIVSTPTGSTAYSLSAGGPIVFPDQDAIIINPICPHTLTNRPVVLPESAVVEVILWTKERGATLTLDGQVSFTLKSGDKITIRKSQYVTNLISSPHRDYVEILRSKLGWGGLPTGITKG
jgi:NAD+ kinase